MPASTTTAKHAEVMIAAADVERSSQWYQELLNCKSRHGGSEFDRLVNGDGDALLLLHRWGAEKHPSMLHRPLENPGAGMVIYFRVPDLDAAYQRAVSMNANLLDEPHENKLARHREYSLRDPDGYFLTIFRS